MRSAYAIQPELSFDAEMQKIAIKALITLIVAISSASFFLEILARINR